jgi:tetratricopeptide (TPR) repeat protein
MTAGGGEEAVLLAARASQSQRRYDLSIPLLEPLAAGDAPSPDALFLLGAAYERTGRRSDAEEVFERLIERVPTHHPALNYLGYMWAEQGENLDRALDLVRRAVAAEPEQGSYLDSLGWVHYQLGDYGLALKYLQRAAVLIPGEAEVQKHLGDVQSALGDTAAARRAYRHALDLAGAGNAEMVAELTRKLELLTAP